MRFFWHVLIDSSLLHFCERYINTLPRHSLLGKSKNSKRYPFSKYTYNTPPLESAGLTKTFSSLTFNKLSMAVKSALIAVAITAAVLGHWTPILLICIIFSVAPQLIAFRDEHHVLAWLADLRAQYSLLWRQWVELLSDSAKGPRMILLEFHLDEHQRRHRTTVAENFLWMFRSGDPTGNVNQVLCTRCTHEAHHGGGHHNTPLGELASQEIRSKTLFVNDLCQAEAQYKEHGAYTSPPNTKFIGPAFEINYDLTKPQLAPITVTVHDIASIARRMGMQWTVFRPEEGILSATGKNRVLYSTFEPRLGTLLHYKTTGDAAMLPGTPLTELEVADIMIPTPQAAMLSFGILPGCKALNLPDYHISSPPDIYTTLNHLDPTRKASQRVRDVRGICPDSAFGFSDLIPLAAPMFRLRGSTIIRIPTPTQYCTGLTCSRPGFVVFRARLSAFINEQEGPVSEHISWVSEQITTLALTYPEWEDEVLANQHANARALEFLESVHDSWDRTTEYFHALENRQVHRLVYADLMAAHIKHAVNYWNDAWSNIREGRGREHFGQRDWMAEGAHCYWDYLTSIEEELKGICDVDGETVKEAWVMMMFRGMCWWRCHWMMGGGDMGEEERVRARYWGSKQEVFLA
jgi:hypothetical protein